MVRCNVIGRLHSDRLSIAKGRAFVRANDANRGPAGVRENRPRGLRIVRLIQHLRPGLDANPAFLMRFVNGSKVLA